RYVGAGGGHRARTGCICAAAREDGSNLCGVKLCRRCRRLNMLSRVADSIYWMSRYTERAENVARFIDVNLQLMLDAPSGQGQQWEPLVSTTGDHEAFTKRCGVATEQNVLHFLSFDAENPNSILSCVRSARENARTIREIISSEMWLQLNKFYWTVTSASENSSAQANS